MGEEKICHSIILGYSSSVIKFPTETIIKKILEHGVKVDIFYTEDVNINKKIKKLKDDEDLKIYIDKYLLNIHKIDYGKSITSIESKWKNNVLLKDLDIKSMIDGVICIDGKPKELLDNLKDISMSFNYEQYKYEHALIYTNNGFIINAGAGSGKTTTTNHRVIYLNHCENIEFGEIHQITFTREAARDIENKLIEQLKNRKLLTKDVRSLIELNEQSQMTISTIDSYIIDIVKAIGPIIGYNKNTKIKSFITERKKLIRDLLEEDKRNVDIIVTKIQLHKLEGVIFEFWNKMNSLGLTDDEIANLKWGVPNKDKYSMVLQELLQNIFNKLPYKLSEIKKRENTAEIHDYTNTLRMVIDKNDSALNEVMIKSIKDKIGQPKLIIVDEMQDSNLSQIKIFAWLTKHLNARLEVVGDIKQAIYRFRGSNETAMDELNKELNNLGIDKIVRWKLNKNYRTEKLVLEGIQEIVMQWGGNFKQELIPMRDTGGVSEKLNILRVSSDKEIEAQVKEELNSYIKGNETIRGIERLISSSRKVIESKRIGVQDIEKECKDYILGIINNNYTGLDDKIVEEIENIIKEYSLDKKTTIELTKILEEGIEKQKTITVLVRYNHEALKIKNLCQKLELPYKINIKGNFFRHRAIMDFKNMLNACNELEYKIARESFKETPYTIQANMTNEEYDDYIKSYLGKYREKFKNERFYTVVNEIINRNNREIKKNYYNESINVYEKKYGKITSRTPIAVKEKMIKSSNLDANEYMENLYKLIDLLEQSLGNNPTIHEVCEYLEIQIKSNYIEEEIRLNGERLGVECYTVHASKGIEYKNVLIPYTNNLFYNDIKRNEIIIDENNNIGWNVKCETNEYNEVINKWEKKIYSFRNKYYESLLKNEEDSIIEDEKRLLYVALTRVKENLTIILLDKVRNNTWGGLIDNAFRL